MKYIKKYESVSADPQEGDYVYSNWSFQEKVWEDYINSHIGQIIEIDHNYRIIYYVKYYVDDQIYDKIFKDDDEEDVIKTEKDGKKYIIMRLYRTDIIEFSSDKEFLKIKMSANKYNL